MQGYPYIYDSSTIAVPPGKGGTKTSLEIIRKTDGVGI
jgi:hypothetical protein